MIIKLSNILFSFLIKRLKINDNQAAKYPKNQIFLLLFILLCAFKKNIKVCFEIESSEFR